MPGPPSQVEKWGRVWTLEDEIGCNNMSLDIYRGSILILVNSSDEREIHDLFIFVHHVCYHNYVHCLLLFAGRDGSP